MFLTGCDDNNDNGGNTTNDCANQDFQINITQECAGTLSSLQNTLYFQDFTSVVIFEMCFCILYTLDCLDEDDRTWNTCGGNPPCKDQDLSLLVDNDGIPPEPSDDGYTQACVNCLNFEIAEDGALDDLAKQTAAFVDVCLGSYLHNKIIHK